MVLELTLAPSSVLATFAVALTALEGDALLVDIAVDGILVNRTGRRL